MTQEEQDTILGRMGREYREAKACLVALQEQARGHAAIFEGLGNNLRRFPPRRELFTQPNFPKVDQAALLEMVDQMIATTARIEDLKTRLTDAGLPPAN